MGNAIRLYETGGPEVMRLEPFDPGPPKAGEIVVRHHAIGVNFIDIYHRTGLYPLPQMPATPGLEGSGVVEAVGDNVSSLMVGDRVAYAGTPPGAYAESRIIPADKVVKLPSTISFQDAAAIMLRGMTARYLLHGCYAVKPGSRIVIQAAAGGVGLLVCQWAKHLGAEVIGTVGSEEKAALAKSYGCDHTILYKKENLLTRVHEITNGKGVDVVYDSIGQATFMTSLDLLRPMGTMVSFGQSSGPIPPFELKELAGRGSLFLTRPSLMDYTAKREDLEAHAHDLFDVVQRGVVKVNINQTFPLAEAFRAHEALESGQTTGSTILLP